MKLIKSIFVLIMAILLIVCAVGCNHTEPTDLNAKPSETTPRKVLPEPEGCVASFSFESLRDMNTYLQTGSTNQDDYLKRDCLFWLSDGYIKLETLQKTYLPLEELFDLSETQMDLAGVNFGAPEDGIFYAFDIENAVVIIKYAPSYYSESISKNPLDYIELGTEDQVINDFSLRSQYDECYISRNVSNLTITYVVEKGAPQRLDLIMGNYKIQVFTDGITNFTTASKEVVFSTYNIFMTSEATAPFAALFSEDDAVVEQALNRIASVIEAKEASIKASAN